LFILGVFLFTGDPIFLIAAGVIVLLTITSIISDNALKEIEKERALHPQQPKCPPHSYGRTETGGLVCKLCGWIPGS
jgi:hypothetical protein